MWICVRVYTFVCYTFHIDYSILFLYLIHISWILTWPFETKKANVREGARDWCQWDKKCYKYAEKCSSHIDDTHRQWRKLFANNIAQCGIHYPKGRRPILSKAKYAMIFAAWTLNWFPIKSSAWPRIMFIINYFPLVEQVNSPLQFWRVELFKTTAFLLLSFGLGFRMFMFDLIFVYVIAILTENSWAFMLCVEIIRTQRRSSAHSLFLIVSHSIGLKIAMSELSVWLQEFSTSPKKK